MWEKSREEFDKHGKSPHDLEREDDDIVFICTAQPYESHSQPTSSGQVRPSSPLKT